MPRDLKSLTRQGCSRWEGESQAWGRKILKKGLGSGRSDGLCEFSSFSAY